MCIECFNAPVIYGGIILLLMAWFLSSHLKRITNIFLYFFSGLQQEVLKQEEIQRSLTRLR